MKKKREPFKPHIHDNEYGTAIKAFENVAFYLAAFGVLIAALSFFIWIAPRHNGSKQGKWVLSEGKRVYCTDAKTAKERFLCFGKEGPRDEDAGKRAEEHHGR